ncbi:MAG: hypothetical protein MK135_14585 [Polyangiaceae bacterium]|nr:hypothetical protein [Polyangiaceae bacterium]
MEPFEEKVDPLVDLTASGLVRIRRAGGGFWRSFFALSGAPVLRGWHGLARLYLLHRKHSCTVKANQSGVFLKFGLKGLGAGNLQEETYLPYGGIQRISLCYGLGGVASKLGVAAFFLGTTIGVLLFAASYLAAGLSWFLASVGFLFILVGLVCDIMMECKGQLFGGERVRLVIEDSHRLEYVLYLHSAPSAQAIFQRAVKPEEAVR